MAEADTMSLHRAIDAVTAAGRATARPVALEGAGKSAPQHVNVAPMRLFAETADAAPGHGGDRRCANPV
jgi:hypothetical protein